jgi:AraC-like DNA-binding protein
MVNPANLVSLVKNNHIPMKLFLKFDPKIALKKIIDEQFGRLHISYNYLGFAEIEIEDTLSGSELLELNTCLNEYGIGIIENQKSILVQKIKDTIREMVYQEEKLPTSNSAYLSEKLKHRYEYISTVFSEVTYTSIENYILLQKTERAKQLIITNELTFSEIAYTLNYSSGAYFSKQFKNVTGITPSTFQRIVNKRRLILQKTV